MLLYFIGCRYMLSTICVAYVSYDLSESGRVRGVQYLSHQHGLHRVPHNPGDRVGLQFSHQIIAERSWRKRLNITHIQILQMLLSENAKCQKRLDEMCWRWNKSRNYKPEKLLWMSSQWSILTGAIVICVVALCPAAAADTQEGLVVIVFIPVKGGHSGESPLGVATYQAGGSSHHLLEGQIVLEERSHDLEKLPGAAPLEQLGRGKQRSWTERGTFRWKATVLLCKRHVLGVDLHFQNLLPCFHHYTLRKTFQRIGH